MNTKTKIALWVAGGLAVMVAGYQLYSYYNLPSTSTQSASAGRVAAATTNTCPGDTESYTLGRGLTKISENSCQLRVVVSGGCALVYDQGRQYIGKICSNGKVVVNGIGYYLSAGSDYPVDATVTRCPFGEIKWTIGSCA